MANSIERIEQYLTQILDTVYKKGSVTSFLDTTQYRVLSSEIATKVLIPKLSFSKGLSDYNRQTGAEMNDMMFEWEYFELEKDRGTTLFLDAVENIESAGVMLANMVSEFVRTKVIPEIDAYRLYTYANKAVSTQKITADLTADDIEAAIEQAEETLENNEVDLSNLILFMSPHVYSLLKQEVKSRRLVTGTVVENAVTTYDDIPVYRVPQNRFNMTVTLGANGYTVAGNPINFMLMDRTAAVQVIRHTSSRLFTPNENQTTDGWKWRCRYFHDASVMENKHSGIYVHNSTSSAKSAKTTEPAAA